MVRIVTFYNWRVKQEVPEAQMKVFKHFNIPLEQIQPENWDGHGGTINKFLKENDWSILGLFDVDCIPLNDKVVAKAIQFAKDGGIYSVAQKANHIPNSDVYASPAFLFISKETYDKIGSPTFIYTDRADTGGEITIKAREHGVKIQLLYPTHVEQPLWELTNNIKFGRGTTYDNSVYHSFLARKKESMKFIKKCEEIVKNI